MTKEKEALYRFLNSIKHAETPMCVDKHVIDALRFLPVEFHEQIKQESKTTKQKLKFYRELEAIGGPND